MYLQKKLWRKNDMDERYDRVVFKFKFAYCNIF